MIEVFTAFLSMGYVVIFRCYHKNTKKSSRQKILGNQFKSNPNQVPKTLKNFIRRSIPVVHNSLLYNRKS